jgi:Secretion system C-terminal sorting domain
MGGTTYLDNVMVSDEVTAVEETYATNTAVYPMPAVSQTTLSFEYEKNSVANLEIYDILGNKVQAMQNIAVVNGSNTIDINTSKLNSGVYMIKLMDSNVILTQKLIVE